jgi:hypothetical protein
MVRHVLPPPRSPSSPEPVVAVGTEHDEFTVTADSANVHKGPSTGKRRESATWRAVAPCW